MPDSLKITTSHALHTGAVADSVGDSTAQVTAAYPMPDTVALRQWKAWTDALHAQQRADSLAAVAERPAPWTTGIVPDDKPVSAATTSGIVAIIVSMLVLVVLCLNRARRLFDHLWRDLTQNRFSRHDMDERPAADSRMIALFAVQTCVYSGILLLGLADIVRPAMIPIMTAGVTLIIVCLLYYGFQLGAYNAVGYAFTDTEHRRAWIRAFNASQGLLGFALMPAAIVTVFYPAAATAALWAAAMLYLVARFFFIVKGFRIFYENFGSLLYFILYLCTLEIIPPLIIIIFTVKAEPFLSL